MVVEAGLSKKLFKIEVLILKPITILLAFLHFLNIVLSYFNIDNLLLSYVASLGLIPLLYLYYISFTHGFCKYHRLFIVYIAVNNAICYLDYKYEFPITNRYIIFIHIIVAFMFLCLITYYKIKYERSNKKVTY